MWQSDLLIFGFINGLAGRNAALDAVGVFAATYLIWLMAAAVLVPVRRAGGNHRRHVAAAVTASRAAAAALLALFGNLLLGLLFFRARPFVAWAEALPLIEVMPTSKSFPSDHATVAFAIACSVWLRRPRLGAALLAAAVLVALGRVYAGVHFPSDVLAGAVVGCLWARLVGALGPRFGEVERIERLLLGRQHKKI